MSIRKPARSTFRWDSVGASINREIIVVTLRRPGGVDEHTEAARVDVSGVRDVPEG